MNDCMKPGEIVTELACALALGGTGQQTDWVVKGRISHGVEDGHEKFTLILQHRDYIRLYAFPYAMEIPDPKYLLKIESWRDITPCLSLAAWSREQAKVWEDVWDAE